jgi:hypothetical protein
VLSYRVILDVPFQLVVFVSELRRAAGSGTGRGAGWAGRPSLPLLFPCLVRAAGARARRR